MDVGGALLFLVVLVGILALLWRAVDRWFQRSFSRITVYEWERGLKYRNGQFRETLGSGVYWVYRPRTEIHKVDVRPTFVSVPGQEVLSSDGVTLKVSLAAQFEITNPDVAMNRVQSYYQALYLILQLALREIIGGATIDEVLARRNELGRLLTEKTTQPIEELGLRLLSVDLKDIMFPGNLQRIFTQVVQAQKEGLATLEKARGETAALRNLANAAKLVEGNPALMQLRFLQHLSAQSGNTLVLGFPTSTTTPLPVREPQGEPGEPPRLATPEEGQ